MLRTSFDPSVEGFQFSNNDIEYQLPTQSRGRFLCGGMIYTALDHWYHAMPMPRTATAPLINTPLNTYIYNRQVAAHVYTVPRMAMGLGQLFVDSLASEYDAIRASIDSGRPVAIFTVEVGHMMGHHVLVIGCQSSPSLGNPILQLYDPNRPREISFIEVLHERQRLWNIGTGRPSVVSLKGFFVDRNYSVHKPPVFEDPVPPAPVPPVPVPPGPVPPAPPGPVPPVPVPPVPPLPVLRTYVVKSGDSLWAIAQKFYGDGNKWPKIYEASRDIVGGNPNLIKVGQVLRVP